MYDQLHSEESIRVFPYFSLLVVTYVRNMSWSKAANDKITDLQ